jgi:ATP-binding protein involved in chromosome partitioning
MEQQSDQQKQAERQLEERILQGRMKEIRYKFLVLSGKGGVGKSTVAANLAISLAREGKKVGLLDVDVHGPSIPKLLGLENSQLGGVGQLIFPIDTSYKLKVMSIGFLLRENTDAVIWRGPLKFNAIRQFLKDVVWGPLDYLVIDSPPGTGDEPLSVAQLVGSPAGAIIVTTPQDVAIADVRRCVSFCNKLSLPVVGIVENMSGLVCPKCGERIDLFKVDGGKSLASEMNVPFLGRIPIDPEIVTSGDDGKPFINNHAHSAAAQAFADVVQKTLANDTQL